MAAVVPGRYGSCRRARLRPAGLRHPLARTQLLECEPQDVAGLGPRRPRRAFEDLRTRLGGPTPPARPEPRPTPPATASPSLRMNDVIRLTRWTSLDATSSP